MAEATDPGADLDLEIKRLEAEKLRAEIDQVRLAWWKRPGYLAGVAPLLIAAAGVASAWASGYFDTRREQLDTRVQELDRVVAVLEQQEASAKSALAEAEERMAEVARREAQAQARIAEQEARAAQLASSERAIKQRLAGIQVQVETTYLKAKSAVGEAIYTLGHLEAFDESVLTLKRGIEAQESLMPDSVAKSMRLIVSDLGGIIEVRKLTRDALDEVGRTIDTVPVSDAIRGLEHDPMAHSKGALRFPDGRYYLIDEGRVLSAEEFRALP